MNKVQLIGRLTNDIDMRYTSQTQAAVGTFTLAVDRLKKADGTDFIRCKVWGKRAEIMDQYIKKGQRVGITGRIETGSYEKNGSKVYTTDVVVEEFDFLESRQRQSYTQEAQEMPDGNDTFAYIDEDIPF